MQKPSPDSTDEERCAHGRPVHQDCPMCESHTTVGVAAFKPTHRFLAQHVRLLESDGNRYRVEFPDGSGGWHDSAELLPIEAGPKDREPSKDYQRGYRDGLEAARQLVIGHQREDCGNLELGAKNRVLKRVANKIYKARKEPVQDV